MLTSAQIGVSSLLHSIVGSGCHDMSSPTMYSQPVAGGCISSALKATLFLIRQNISPASGPIRQNPSALRIEKELYTQCSMLPLSTKGCLKSNKLRLILNGQFCHAISKNICLNVLGSKQPWEILVLWFSNSNFGYYAPVATAQNTWKILITGAS